MNLAARLQDLADPSGIYISDEVHRHVEGKIDLPFVDLGEQHVKNIVKPVRVYRVRVGHPKNRTQIAKAIGIGVCRDVPGLQGHTRRHISR